MTSGIETVYNFHHTHNRRENLALFKDLRGEFLRSNIGTDKKVLDIGCRDGELTETYYKGNEVLGVDIDSRALELAEKKLGIKTLHRDLNGDWSLPPDSFDVVVAAEVVEHIYYPDQTISKIAKVLKKDGVLLGSVPNAFSLKNRIRLLLGQKRHTPLADPTHINHFTRRELENLLGKYFEEVSIVPAGRFAYLEKWFPGMFSFMMLFKAKGKK